MVAILGAAAVAANGSGIPQEVDRQLLRALCVVRRGDCQQDRRPCPVDIDRRREALALKVLVFRLGEDKMVIREQRSDGTIAVTVAYGGDKGLELTDGARVGIALGNGGLDLGGELTAAAVASREHGLSWVVHGDSAADALIGHLGLPLNMLEFLIRARRLPEPAQVYEEGGLSVTGGVSRSGLARVALGLSSQDVSGVRTDVATGQRTFYVQRTVDGALSLTRTGSGTTVMGTDRERYAVTYDAGGRPLDLMVMTTGTFRTLTDLPGRLRSMAGMLARSGHGHGYVEETHLDLTDPESLRAAGAFLAQVTHPHEVHLGDAVAVAAALRRRLDEAGVIHARTYDVDHSRYGVNASVSIEGVRLGGEASRTHEDSHLVAAATRGIDGVWRRRADCLAQA